MTDWSKLHKADETFSSYILMYCLLSLYVNGKVELCIIIIIIIIISVVMQWMWKVVEECDIVVQRASQKIGHLPLLHPGYQFSKV